MTTNGERKHYQFCILCEAACGMIASVDQDNAVTLRPDPDHPNSAGHACAKGILYPAVTEDPDRVTHPLRRLQDGSFERVSWDEAFDDIGKRLNKLIAEHGQECIGTFFGNPTAFNYRGFLSLFGLAAALDSKHFYSTATVDVMNYWVVGELLYGHNFIIPVPDVDRTDFFLCVGANPFVSHGSLLNIGNMRKSMLDVTKRGGRVVVVDPRRTETAKNFEHVGIIPGTDPWLIGAMLKVILDEGLEDSAALAATRGGRGALERVVGDIDIDRAASETGVSAEDIAQLARDFANAKSACAYGRCGASLGPFSTLTKYLLDALNLATGNWDRPGGSVLGDPWLDTDGFTKRLKMTGYDRWRSRVDGHPEVAGLFPVATMPTEIRTPGKGKLRVLISGFSNSVMAAPNSTDMEDALSELDLLISLDPYITETSRLAHYVLPPTLWYERENMPLFTQPHSNVPYAQWTEAIVPPRGEAREDSWIIDQITRRIGLVPSPAPGMQLLGKLGIRIKAEHLVDILVRLGPHGDRFGLRRGGLSRKKLMRELKGAPVKLHDAIPTGGAAKRLFTKDKRIHLDHPLFVQEARRMAAAPAVTSEEFPLLMFSIRELRTHNTWMHNVPKLMAGGFKQTLRIHPDDAATRGIEDGDSVTVSSAVGVINVEAHVSDEVIPGSIGLPTHWGHKGGQRLANTVGGANYNVLTANGADAVDKPSGQAIVNGVAVQVVKLAPAVEERVARSSSAATEPEFA